MVPLQAVAAPCAPGAFLLLEQGKLAAVDWVEHSANQVHTRTILTQSLSVDATFDLRPDQTASHSSVILTRAGQPAGAPIARDTGQGAIVWSDFIVSSVEMAIERARVLNRPTAEVLATSPYRDAPTHVLVERLDPTDWIVTYRDKRYRALTDEAGCLVAATLPEYGVVIERRAAFAAGAYPLWPAYDAPPDGAYRAVQVTIPAPQGHSLAGTLTLPKGRGPVGVAVLITGLGASERNGGSPPWMPLRDMADALTRAGVAVLRVDDRGVGQSTGDHKPSTTFDEADDVRAEVAWLRRRPGIDPRRVALVGYSEGGLIGPMVAARDPTIAAVVTLAGPGVPGPTLAREQIEEIVAHDPAIAPADRAREVEKQLAEPLTPRETSFLSIDPLAFASAVRCPALILQGGADITVPIRSAERLAAAMRAGGNRDVTVRIFPGVSHALLPDTVGASDRWLYLPAFETAPQLLDVLAQWTAAHLAPSRVAQARGRIGAIDAARY